MATQTVQTVSDIPKALEPFFVDKDKGLIPRGVAEIFRPYEERYAPLIRSGLVGAGTVAPMSQAQQAVGKRLENMQLPQQFGLATEAGQQAASGLQSLLGLQASNVVAPDLTMYQMGPAERVSSQDLETFQMGPAQTFGTAQMQQYMSPYVQGVIDVQQRQAVDAAKQAQLSQNLAAARQGTYGGARQAILQSQREAGLRTQLGDIQRTGLQSAFEQAQQQFERDRAAQMGVSRENLAAALGVQQLESEAALRSALANQQAGLTVGQQNLAAALGVQQLGAGQSLEAQRANQAAALQAAQQRAQAAQGLTSLAQTFGGLGTQQLAGELDITKTLGAYGDLQRALAQQQMDAERGYRQQQAEYGLTQVGDLSNLLRGIPMTDTTQTVSTPPPSFASQLTGLGLTGIGLYNLLGGGK